ncbi:serine protease SohB [Cognatiyoonia sediminum]|uniref:Serine protease SohB n=1 Tax=Cognatiyoonia sediminum TaxID=1508389 RepID=A0A1M5Q0H5_9RHOB|nr:S49 family peptidase [Cognatiyoonia sediminum]SHH07654.1 serine protease SohB [Cognatiyoonia sediminum]
MKNILPFMKSDPLVNVVRLQGAITNSGSGLDDPSLAPVIEKAFRKGKPQAVALQINCPGGSPVQSSLIAARIQRLSAETEVPVYAFVEDVAASGGYWLACAADEIYVDQGSIVGSIGVISAGFGFQDAIERYGVERRVHTAGKSKSMLDPFKPLAPADVKRLKGWLEDLHAIFIDHVKARRGDKLSDNPDLFTGEVFIGQKGVDQGLADGIEHLVPFMKAQFGDKVRFRRFGQRKSLLQRVGARVVGDAIGSLEERAAFARFGL